MAVNSQMSFHNLPIVKTLPTNPNFIEICQGIGLPFLSNYWIQLWDLGLRCKLPPSTLVGQSPSCKCILLHCALSEFKNRDWTVQATRLVIYFHAVINLPPSRHQEVGERRSPCVEIVERDSCASSPSSRSVAEQAILCLLLGLFGRSDARSSPTGWKPIYLGLSTPQVGLLYIGHSRQTRKLEAWKGVAI